MSGEEFRNATRRGAREYVEVVDTMTERRIGQIHDLSATGMQIRTAAPLVQDALYQLRFNLSGADHNVDAVECGVHVLWVRAESPGEYAAGLRFIHLSNKMRVRIQDWAEAHAGHGA